MLRRWNEIAPLPVRIAFGGGFMLHGYSKLFTPDGYQNILYMMHQVPTPVPWLMAYVIGGLEFFGGLALVTGTCVGTVSVLFIVGIASNIAMQLVRGDAPQPLNPNQPFPGIESSLLCIAASIALFIGGAGGYSVTRMFVPRPSD
jgi:putative oxidoreductase